MGSENLHIPNGKNWIRDIRIDQRKVGAARRSICCLGNNLACLDSQMIPKVGRGDRNSYL